MRLLGVEEIQLPQEKTKELKRNDSEWEETLPAHKVSHHTTWGKAFGLDACKERKSQFDTEKLSFYNLLSHVDISGEGSCGAATKQNLF